LIETFALTKRYGDKVAVNELSLTVAPGEVMGFLGPNGSGKTTTIRLLMGLLKPSAGRATILGRDCHSDSVALKREVGYLPDEPFLYPYLSGQELLELCAGLHGYRGAEARRRANAAAERFDIAKDTRAFTVTYSHGMRKRLALAAALIHDPRVLILDEPTNGLDPRGARDMRAIVGDLAASGRTVFLSTHLLDAAEKLCHRVAIIREGALLAVGTPAELQARYASQTASPSAGASGGAPGSTDSLEDLFLKVTS
jgi:ABC-2 type transport system ATP-binding protein